MVPCNPKFVLVVSDDQQRLVQCSAILKASDCNPLVAVSAKLAVRIVGELEVSCVVFDSRTSSFQTADVAKAITTLRPRIPIVLADSEHDLVTASALTCARLDHRPVSRPALAFRAPCPTSSSAISWSFSYCACETVPQVAGCVDRHDFA